MFIFCRRLVFSCCLTLMISVNSWSGEVGGAISFEKTLNEDSSLLFDYDYRAIDYDLFYRHYEIGYLKRFKDDWAARVSHRVHYRYIESQSDWKVGHTPFLAIFKNFRGKKVDFQNRFIHEYIFDNEGGNLSRARYRAALMSSKHYKGFQPFIADEFFYNYRSGRYFRNWIMVGTVFNVDKDLRLNIFYRNDIQESQRDNDYWNSRNGIFVSAYFIF